VCTPAFEAPDPMEGAMRTNLPSKSVPRAEYDYRAREARLQLEELERLLVTRHAVKKFLPFRRFRLLAFNVSGTAQRSDRSTGSPSDRRPCDMLAPLLAPSATAPVVVSCRNPSPLPGRIPRSAHSRTLTSPCARSGHQLSKIIQRITSCSMAK
jgi:hypothetical protein